MSIFGPTVKDYLAAEESARRNGADKPKFKRLLDEVRRAHPESRERLSLGLIETVRKTLVEGADPKMLVVSALRWAGDIRPSAMQQYINVLDDIAHQAFELMGAEDRGSKYPAFYLALNDTLRVLRRLDRNRFEAVLRDLQGRVSADGDGRQQILSKLK